MDKYELTENEKVVNGVKVFQIRAKKELSVHGIYVGELGGWVNTTGLSQEGDCWVMPEATLINSTVTGDTLVEAGLIENSTLHANKITCLSMKETTIKGAFVVIGKRSIVARSLIETEGSVNITDGSELQECKIYASDVQIDDSSLLTNVILRGEKITITKKSAIAGSNMNGKSINITDSVISKGTHLAGENILVQESEIQDFNVAGDDMTFLEAKMVKGRARGDRMTIKDEVDIFNCHIEGKDILFDGKVKFHNSYIAGSDQSYKGTLDIEWVYFYGDGICLDGFAFLRGKEEDNTFQIKNNSKLDGIIHIEATDKDLAIDGETLYGDFSFTC